MEPGKIPHEIRHGELAQLGILPYQPYYGTHDATSLFVIVLPVPLPLARRRDVIRRYLPNAEAAMSWIDRYGDRDRDGFQEYRTRSTHGYYNQGWKDAGDAIPHADGSLAPLPIALCELQGYAYDAKLRMAGIYDLLGRPKDAAPPAERGAALFERVQRRVLVGGRGDLLPRPRRREEAHPVGGVQRRAPALVGHRARRSAPAGSWSGLLRRDMWSGWGIRTLSSDHVVLQPVQLPHRHASGRTTTR